MSGGTMIVVVGPSGAGKDSVMAYASCHIAGEGRVQFVRRVITRPADAGGEAHEAIDAAGFRERQAKGGFAVSWDAHGLSYGIPSETHGQLADGMTLIANGSRSALPRFADAYPSLKVAVITARPEILAQRLAARGRETAEVIARRLARETPEIMVAADTVVIDNSGPLEEAGEAFVTLLRATLSPISNP